MYCDLININARKVIHVVYSNFNDKLDLKEFGNKLSDLIQKHKLQFILLDFSQFKESISLIDQYNFLNAVFGSLLQASKLALLYNQFNEVNKGFINDIAFKRVVDVKLFDSKTDAVKWLIKD